MATRSSASCVVGVKGFSQTTSISHVSVSMMVIYDFSEPTVFAGLQRELGESEMRIGGSGDDDHVDRGVLDHLLGGAERFYAGVIDLDIIILLRCALDNCVKVELGDFLHEGNVKDLCAEAVADNADIVNLAGHGGS